MDKLILTSKKLGFIDTIDNIHHDDSNEIIREKFINRFEDCSYFSYFEKVYVAFGNTLRYYVINYT
jgi:AAA15 family ATPase/GTPase